jgi:hypothetical protein
MLSLGVPAHAKGRPPAHKKVPVRQQVVERAAAQADAARPPPDGVTLVRGAYGEAGVTLPGAQGVHGLWRAVVEKGALKLRAPRPGDIVFFRGTHDANRDGRLDDGLTHVGLVERVGRDGTVTFLHHFGGSVVRGRLNTEQASRRFDWEEGRVLNDVLRPATFEQAPALAGELFAGYGSASVLTGMLAPKEAQRTAARREAPRARVARAEPTRSTRSAERRALPKHPEERAAAAEALERELEQRASSTRTRDAGDAGARSIRREQGRATPGGKRHPGEQGPRRTGTPAGAAHSGS